jgi:ABC-type multidrug transport system fused ATPase/permease subunit
MLKAVRQIVDLLTAQEKRRSWILACMIVVMGLIDAIGVASVLPFLTVLTQPTVVSTNNVLAAIYQRIGFAGVDNFLLFLGTITFLFITFGQAFKALTNYVVIRFSKMRESAIGNRLFVHYLNQPYEWFLARNSAQLGSYLLSEVDKIVNGVLMPMLMIAANGIVCLFLLLLLVYVQPLAAVATAVAIGGTYCLIFFLVRKYLVKAGNERIISNQDRYRAIQEALGGIKDVKLLALEPNYTNRFNNNSIAFARQEAAASIVSQLPRYLLEVIIFGGMVVLLLVLLAAGEGRLEAALPVVGVYALAGLRFFPAMQQIYTSFAVVRFNQPALDALHSDLEQLVKPVEALGKEPNQPEFPMPNLRESIELRDVHYKYPAAGRSALRGLRISIEARTTVAVVGKTGSGKTTLIDILLGLLAPQAGRLLVDGIPVDGRSVRAWQRRLGYVPQNIFLEDATVASNIALGQSPDKIDYLAVHRAARIADIHDFVVNDLPQGYLTKVGERGVRLSGGQRQRIGIARALYHDPEVLVFDEATSALDNLTERAVMDAVRNISRQKTIIIVAHRLSTVQDCDNIFVLENGSCIGNGRFAELTQNNSAFREMASAMGSDLEMRHAPRSRTNKTLRLRSTCASLNRRAT